MIKSINSSALHRVMTCAGSVHFKDLPKLESSPMALEGIAAAEAFESLVKGLKPNIQSKDGTNITQEMIDYIKPFVNSLKGYDLFSEQEANWLSDSNIVVKGRYDLSYVKDNEIHIVDLKYGWTIVEPKNNWQLVAYAIGEVFRRKKGFDKYHLTVFQPRPGHEEGPVRTWTVTHAELEALKAQIDSRLTNISEGLNDLTTGSQCYYCPAATSCPALNKAFFRGVDLVHNFVQDDMTNDELSFQLTLIDRIEEMVKIKKGSLHDLAKQRIKAGAMIKDWVCQPSYGYRKWKDDVTIESIEIVTGKKVAETVILSPAKVQKLGVPKEILDVFTETPLVGEKLVKKDSRDLGNKIFGAVAPQLKE